ncbi:hypothetical protein, partial [Klebsiella aerogenes]|uniref:hypothetical protein n=1 Tax=Klebsiella aerogenes TaxID=548 RepID=UPI0013D78A01
PEVLAEAVARFPGAPRQIVAEARLTAIAPALRHGRELARFGVPVSGGGRGDLGEPVAGKKQDAIGVG